MSLVDRALRSTGTNQLVVPPVRLSTIGSPVFRLLPLKSGTLYRNTSSQLPRCSPSGVTWKRFYYNNLSVHSTLVDHVDYFGYLGNYKSLIDWTLIRPVVLLSDIGHNLNFQTYLFGGFSSCKVFAASSMLPVSRREVITVSFNTFKAHYKFDSTSHNNEHTQKPYLI